MRACIHRVLSLGRQAACNAHGSALYAAMEARAAALATSHAATSMGISANATHAAARLPAAGQFTRAASSSSIIPWPYHFDHPEMADLVEDEDEDHVDDDEEDDAYLYDQYPVYDAAKVLTPPPPPLNPGPPAAPPHPHAADPGLTLRPRRRRAGRPPCPQFRGAG